MPQSERGSQTSGTQTKQRPEQHRETCGCELTHYTAIQAAFSRSLLDWQRQWHRITTESLLALPDHGIAISYRQSLCGGYVATLLHRDGGGIDSGLCPSLQEARSFVLGQGLEETP
jgi:hypothetical protein